jgi:Xaa-Pro aminopeptidase
MPVNPSVLPPLETDARIGRLREQIVREELDCLLVVALPNIRYLTGFTGSAALLLVTRDGARLATDGRYRTQAAEELEAAGVPGTVEVVVGRLPAQTDSIVDLVRETLGSAGGRVGLEAEHMVWAQKRRWSELLFPSDLMPTSGMVEKLREKKDAGEVARIERAAAIADAALAEIAPMLAEGNPATGREAHTESEIALALDVAMRRLGAEDRAFETIVASGPNSAKPHARPGDRRIAPGDAIVVDFGAMVDGYRSDMTRTFLTGLSGEVPERRMHEVYEAVLESQRAGVKAVKAGVSGGDIDQACRESLVGAGLGEAFEHGTGHGVGLDIHEAPSVGPGSTGILDVGTVVTVEPGAYLAGLGGVRIEDTVVVTADGCRTLTSFTKSFAVPSL